MTLAASLARKFHSKGPTALHSVCTSLCLVFRNLENRRGRTDERRVVDVTIGCLYVSRRNWVVKEDRPGKVCAELYIGQGPAIEVCIDNVEYLIYLSNR